MTTLNKSDLQKFAEQSGLQVDGRSEFAYTDRLEHFSRLVRLDLELEIDDLKDQLAKAEQLWQVAQGRCDGLEDQLAKAEQRVAEWQPISTAPKDGTVFLGYKLGQFRECYKVPRDDCDMWCFGGTSGASCITILIRVSSAASA